MDKKTNKSTYFNNSCFLKSSKESFLWPGTDTLAEAVLTAIPYCKSSSCVINVICHRNRNFLSENGTALLFLKKLEERSYEELTRSVLFYFLQKEYKEKNESLDYIDWLRVVQLLLQPAVTDSVLLFMEQQNLAEFLRETKT